MGSDSSLTEENNNLKTQIEELEQENRNVENEIRNNEIDGTEIQKILEENYKMEDNIKELKHNIDCLNAKYKNLTTENVQLKTYCGQLQLMTLRNMQPMTFSQNLNNFNAFQNQVNSYQNQINNFINNNNNNFNNSFNNNLRRCQTVRNNQNIITIIFNYENRQKYPIVALPDHKLGNIFLLLLNQVGNSIPFNILNLKFEYNAIDITDHFLNNLELRSLNLHHCNPIINIRRINP